MSDAATLVQIFVNKECNLHCPYCFVKKFPSKFCPEKIELPDSFREILILGGEPGLLDKKEVEILFEKLKGITQPISIATNGLFIKKYYDLYPNFQYVYHITDYKTVYDLPNITNLIVVTSTNIDTVLKLVQDNMNINFSINENLFEHLISIPIVNKKYLKLLTLPNVNKICKRYKNQSSLPKEVLYIIDAYEKI